VASRERGAALVLTGTAADRTTADEVRRGLPADAAVVDTIGGAPLLRWPPC